MRQLAWFAGGFGAACLISCYLFNGILPAVLCILLCALSLLVWYGTRPKGFESPDPSLLARRRRLAFQLFRRTAALSLGAAAAFLWYSGYSALFYAPAARLAGTEQTISGEISSYPEETSIGGYSMTLRLDGDFRSPDILIYGSEDWGDLRPGDRVSCTARLNSSEFLYGDETTYYTAKGVFLLGYCNDAPVVERADSIPVRYWPDWCARHLHDGIYAAFDELAAPLAAAVTLGDKDGLIEQLYSALNRSGIMHAAVVSGMHISFLVSLLLLLCRGRRSIALCLIPILIFFALMAGGTPSAFRAVIMQAALLAGPVLRREHDAPTALGLALLVLLIQNPFAAASVSLQLSFFSVAGILLVSARISAAMLAPARKPLRNKGRFGRAALRLYRVLCANVGVTLGAMLFTTPLIAFYFGQIGLIAALTNILTLWAVTLLMVCALVIGTLAIFFPAAMVWPGFFAGLPAHYIRAVVSLLGRLPLASLDGTNRYFQIWLLAVYLFLLTIVFASKRGRQALLVLLCLAFLLCSAVGLNRWTVRRSDLTITALDVGQGASTLVLSGSSAVLVDCGGSASSSAGDLAADYLASMGRTDLDALVLTHLDDDHFNGVAQLFWRLDVARVFLPETKTEPDRLAQLLELAAEEGAEVTFVTEPRTFLVGKAELTLYPPLSGGTSNEEGLFVLCSHDGFDALITGDADAFVEKMLLKYYPVPDLELLLVGHHGSKHSTSAELLDALRPELAIISVGYNSYGHPAQETLDRLTSIGTEVYRTDLSGPITVSVRDHQISIR